jgi:hypothetical protein
MRIKKLEISYGGYFSTNYEVKKKRNKLYFEKWDYAPYEKSPIEVYLKRNEWSLFTTRLIEIIADWRPIYDIGACDGTQWTVDIQTQESKYHIYGSNDYPDNFEELVILIRSFGGFESFANGFLDTDQDDDEQTDQEP